MRLDEQTVFVFDLDDTLYLERDYVLSGFRAVGRWLPSNCGWSDFDAIAFSERCCELFRSGQRGNIFDLALQQETSNSRLVWQRPVINDLVHAYRSHRPTIRGKRHASVIVDQPE